MAGTLRGLERTLLALVLFTLGCSGRTERDDNADAAGGSNTGGSSDAAGGPPNAGGLSSGGAAATGGTLSFGGVGTNSRGGADISDDSGGTVSLPSSQLPPSGAVWRDTPSRFCAGGTANAVSYGPYADSRGVYFLRGQSPEPLSLYFNDGQGWTEQATPITDTLMGLTGFAEGPLLAYGGSSCGVNFLDGSATWCGEVEPNAWPAFVSGAESAYAWRANSLLRYDANGWVAIAQVPGAQAYSLWANGDAAWVGLNGQVLRFAAGESSSPSAAALGSAIITALWGFGSDDVWAGSASGTLYHFDGADWTPSLSLAGDCPGIRGMWGSDGVLFLYTFGSVHRLENGKLTTLLSVPCSKGPTDAQIRGLWGLSPNEVFISATETVAVQMTGIEPPHFTAHVPLDPCGVVRLLWYDGNQVSPF